MLMLFLYRLIFVLIYLVVYPYAKIRSAFGSRLWRERLGGISIEAPVEIWMHAASVGETKVLSHLVNYLMAKRPEMRIHVTVVTKAGYATAEREFGKIASISFAPIDSHIPVAKFYSRLQPKVLVLAETEIWPGLILKAADNAIPIVSVNARMSQQSFVWYKRISSSMRLLFEKYQHFFFRTVEDAARYRQLGVAAHNGTVAGDMKFDAPAKVIDPKILQKHRDALGLSPEDFVFVAGSTREKEEAMLLQAFAALSKTNAKLKLILAPRHIDRAETVRNEAEQMGIPIARYSEAKSTDRVLLVDRMGILQELFALANIAFVGGTLVPIGGHNLLEPVWVGTPVLFGPYTENVTSAEEFVLSGNYGRKIIDTTELTNALESYYLHRTMFARFTLDSTTPNATAQCGDYLVKLLNGT
jgi:3-deoxy-D-manno-octulosonic-acid transferase